MKTYDVVFIAAAAFGLYVIIDGFRSMEALISGAVIGVYLTLRCRCHDH